MTRRLKRIGPLKFGIVAAIIQALLSLIVLPFFLLGIVAGAFAPHQVNDGFPQGLGLVICILLPFIYAIFGFIFGCLAALVYNLVAKLTGGIEFVVD